MLLSLLIFTLKQPSASVNPAIQKGLMFYATSTTGLSTGVISGKDSFNCLFFFYPKAMSRKKKHFFVVGVPSP